MSLVFGETEERPGGLTRIHTAGGCREAGNCKKEKAFHRERAEGDRRLHTSVHTCTYFQMTRGGEAATPKTPDPDEEWSKREWEKAMAKWRNQLKQWERNA